MNEPLTNLKMMDHGNDYSGSTECFEKDDIESACEYLIQKLRENHECCISYNLLTGEVLHPCSICECVKQAFPGVYDENN